MSNDAERLRQLKEEVARIADALSELSESEAAFERTAGKATGKQDIDVTELRAMIRARRLRDQYFHSALFGDPAWDMLLDLITACSSAWRTRRTDGGPISNSPTRRRQL